MIKFHVCCLLLLFLKNLSADNGLRSMNDDILSPYNNQHGSKHSNRQIREIQSHEHGESTFEMWPGHSSIEILPITNTSYFVSDIPLHTWGDNTHVYGHYTKIRNPSRTFSVVEALGNGCHINTTATVEATAKTRKCVVAQNGGFFRTRSGHCLGNVISDGKHVQDSFGVQNAHFGITKNGTIVVGYLSESDIAMLNFSQLIGGVIWLVRKGASYVEESIKLESSETEETGTLQYFADVQSARTAIGHDRDGHVIFVEVDGQTGSRGTNLHGFAKFLIEELHLINAINLDGGGSATLVLNGTLANYPSDHCVGARMWRCPRSVTTVVCAHGPDCIPPCQHGDCAEGRCKCSTNWIGGSCNVLKCGHHNCSSHGTCNSDGCLCNAGWHGNDCSVPCKPGRFGVNCTQHCVCKHGSECDSVSGNCSCSSGYAGYACDQVCPAGRYGRNCAYHCHCSESCLCNPITGQCLTRANVSEHQDILNVSKCLARTYWKLLPFKTNDLDHYDFQFLTLLYVTIGGLMVSLFFNIIFMWRSMCRKTWVVPQQEESSSDDSRPSTEESQAERSPSSPTEERILSKWRSVFKFSKRNSHKYAKLDTTEQNMEMEEISLLNQIT